MIAMPTMVMDRLRATPVLGAVVLASVVVLLASSSLRLSLLAAVLAVVGIFIARRWQQDTACAEATDTPRRVGSCSLGPGASVHVIICGERRLLVGVTNQRITVLDRDAAPARRALGAAFVLAASLALAPAPARAAEPQGSTTQAVDLGPAAREGSSALPRGSGVENPPVVRTSPVDPKTVESPPLTPLALLVFLAILPFVFMSVTSFVKISVVLSLVRSALGTPQAPSDPVLAGIALSLTLCVMAPVMNDVLARAGACNADANTLTGAIAVATASMDPVRAFLKRNTRPDEIALFVELASARAGRTMEPDSASVLVPAFVTSELRQAFITGFILFIPFLVVDMVVANILMSMGMIMISPNTVSMPFKLMLFVLIDGWPLLMKGLALSYH